MRWLSHLFSRKPSDIAAVKPSIAIPIPEGTDPKMWERARQPIRNRNKYAAEEIAADELRYKKEMREKLTQLSKFNRERAQGVGCKSFVWRSAGDSDVCAECAKNNGKRFSYSKPPKIGYPGEHECRVGWCRCVSESLIPKNL